MRMPLRQAMTVQEYLEWEQHQEDRYEYDGYGPVLMAGAREAHADIQRNLMIAVGTRLRGRSCRVYGTDMKMATGGDSYRFPDALIVCGPRDSGRVIAKNPVVVFEILSDSTGGTDRVTKFFEYRAVASVQRYILIEQSVVGAEVRARADDWAGRMHAAGSILPIPEADIELPLDELYDGLDLSP